MPEGQNIFFVLNLDMIQSGSIIKMFALPPEILALFVNSLGLNLPLRTRLLWTFSLRMLMSLARLLDPDATLPLRI